MARVKEGDRVKRYDADRSNVRAYREMRGTVKATHPGTVQVAWDCDGGSWTNHWEDDVVHAEESDGD